RPAATKRDLIRHNALMAPAMLPYLAGRPVELHRFPNGVDQPGSWHASAPSRTPSGLTTWDDAEADPGDARHHLVLDSPAALAWGATHGAVETQPGPSTAAAPPQPTWAMFAIAPGTDPPFAQVVELARLHRVALGHLGLQAMPKVTGRRGIEIWLPVAK